MKHAGATALRSLADLLKQIRLFDGIKEERIGIFYRKSRSFIHFHEDPVGLFADLSRGADFDRYPVNTQKERKSFLIAVKRALDA